MNLIKIHALKWWTVNPCALMHTREQGNERRKHELYQGIALEWERKIYLYLITVKYSLDLGSYITFLSDLCFYAIIYEGDINYLTFYMPLL